VDFTFVMSILDRTNPENHQAKAVGTFKKSMFQMTI